MKRWVIIGFLAALLTAPMTAASGKDRGGECEERSNCGNTSERCSNAQDRCSGSFSPQFDRSPVDIHDNNVCLPMATCNFGEPSERQAPE